MTDLSPGLRGREYIRRGERHDRKHWPAMVLQVNIPVALSLISSLLFACYLFSFPFFLYFLSLIFSFFISPRFLSLIFLSPLLFFLLFIASPFFLLFSYLLASPFHTPFLFFDIFKSRLWKNR